MSNVTSKAMGQAADEFPEKSGLRSRGGRSSARAETDRRAVHSEADRRRVLGVTGPKAVLGVTGPKTVRGVTGPKTVRGVTGRRAVRGETRWKTARQSASRRLAAASLAGFMGLGAAAWGTAASAQAGAETVAASTSSALSVRSTSSAWSTSNRIKASQGLKASIQPLVRAGYPGALAARTDADGNSVAATAGKGNLATGEAPPLDGEVRIGSNTKTFVAVLIMKMVEKGQIKLDEPIETYLPGLIKGQGVDGAKITVRQLLQHTSGLPEMTEGLPDFFAIRNDYISPRDILDDALKNPAQFAPGATFKYTNTNYIVLGLLVERVGKRPIAEQIDAKIVKPLGLRHTYMPDVGERTLRGKHPHGYHTRDNKPGKLLDLTVFDPSLAWAAGSMVSTPSELNKFMQSIFDGSLLQQKSIAEMKKSVPIGGGDGAATSTGSASSATNSAAAWPGATVAPFQDSRPTTLSARTEPRPPWSQRPSRL